MYKYVIATEDVYCSALFYTHKGYTVNRQFPKGTIFAHFYTYGDAYRLVRNGVIIPNEGGVLGLMYSKQITEHSVPYKPSPII